MLNNTPLKPCTSSSGSYFKSYTDNDKDVILYLNTANSSNNIKIFVNPISHKNTTSNIKEFNKDFAYLLNSEQWVKDFINESMQLNDAKALLPYYNHINSMLANGKFDLCNILFKNINIKRLSNVLLVGLLRLTFSQKHKIPSWPILLKSSRHELILRGFDANIVLRGLY